MKKINYVLKNFEEILCSIFLTAVVSLVIVNVFLRYTFDYSIYWAEEVSTICFVWLVFVSASAVYKHKMDMGIDVLILKLPIETQKLVRFIVSLILLLINSYICYMSFVFTASSYYKPTAVLGFSSAVINSALMVGFGLITLHTLRFIKNDFLELSQHKGAK